MRFSDWSSDVCSSDLALAPQAVIAVHSQASDRATYLRRPDLGRRLDPAGLPLLEAARGDWDVAFVIADGLSARAVAHHAVLLLQACLPRLDGWRLAPVLLAGQARVGGKSVGSGKSGSVRAGTGGSHVIKQKTTTKRRHNEH